MNKKIYYLFLLLLVSVFTKMHAQEIYFETGKSLSTFDYKNSKGEKLDNVQATSHNIISAGYAKSVFTDNLKVSLGSSYAGYGAIASDDLVGTKMKWDLNYLEFALGIDYTVAHFNSISLYLKGATSMSFLVQGSQVINNKVIDLKGNDNFDSSLNSFKIGGGIQVPATDQLSIYIQYMYGKSLSNKKYNTTTGRKDSLRIQNSTISIGMAIQLFSS